MRKYLFLIFFCPLFITAQDSLDIKIGQMIFMGLDNMTRLDKSKPIFKDLKEGKVGGVILYAKHLDRTNTKKSLKEINTYIQEVAPMKTFIAIDEEGGRVNRLKPAYGFPKTLSARRLGRMDNEDTTRLFARNSAQAMQQVGINMNFAPDVDVDINPKNPVIGGMERSYSSDYRKVAEHAYYVLDEQQRLGVINVLKHFPGHGSSASDTHYGVADVSTSWKMEEMYPYRILLDSGKVYAIMTAHIVNERLDPKKHPATLSYPVISEMLRMFIGFDGVVISDDMQMHAISKQFGFEESILMAIEAGVDMLMFANNTELSDKVSANDIHQIIKKQVMEGKISEQRINASYQRIMSLKKML